MDNQNTAPNTEQPSGQQAPANQKPFTIDDVTRTFFAPNELDKAQEMIGTIQSLGIDFKMNFNPETPLPEGYGLVILPLQKRKELSDGKGGKETKTVTTGVAVCGVPTLERILKEGEKGDTYVRSMVLNGCLVKLSNALREKDDGSVAGNPPFTVEDFIESRRGGETLKTFSEISPRFVKALREKGLKVITASLLKQVLASKQYAEAHFPRIKQESWVGVINMMITTAKAENLDTATFEHWLATRDTISGDDVTEFELAEDDLAK